MKAELTPEFHETLDEVLAHFIKTESELGQSLLDHGANPSDVTHMANVHFHELMIEVWGPKWVAQLRKMGLKPKPNGNVAP